MGGVVTVRYGENSGSDHAEKDRGGSWRASGAAVIDWRAISEMQNVFAKVNGFVAFKNGGQFELNQTEWLAYLHENAAAHRPAWLKLSKVTIVPFYDRTGLIYETLGTLNTAIFQEILVTIIVVLVMVRHLGSSALISGLLPLAVLMTFIAMRHFGVDANIVALSGIAIAIGTMVVWALSFVYHPRLQESRRPTPDDLESWWCCPDWW